MSVGGDEIGRTQHGNNNAYCQDNEITWFDWADVREKTAFCWTSPPDSQPFAPNTRSFTAAAISRAAPSADLAGSMTSSGSIQTAMS